MQVWKKKNKTGLSKRHNFKLAEFFDRLYGWEAMFESQDKIINVII